MASGVPLADYGIAHADFGHAPPAEHQPLNQHGHVIEHYVRDLTVRVAAGCTIGDLQQSLAQQNQFLPVDADSDVTIGEIITCHMYGPLRTGFGSVRDLLLGLAFIDGHGRDIRVGGRTVKNVAGLDVTRFMVGSLGEFGFVHEATLRTFAVPERVLSVTLAADASAHFAPLLQQVLLTDANPARMSLHRMREHWNLELGYFGTQAACLAQLRSLESLLTDARVRIRASVDQHLPDDEAMRAGQRSWRREAGALVKVIVRPSDTFAVLEAIERFEATESACEHLHVEALPSFGCVFAGCSMDAARAARLDSAITQAIPDATRQWLVRPVGTETPPPVAPLPPALSLLHRIKSALDPHNVLNTGRTFTPKQDAAR